MLANFNNDEKYCLIHVLIIAMVRKKKEISHLKEMSSEAEAFTMNGKMLSFKLKYKPRKHKHIF